MPIPFDDIPLDLRGAVPQDLNMRCYDVRCIRCGTHFQFMPPVPLRSIGADAALLNFRDAMAGIGNIRVALEETFGGLSGTHPELDVLQDCKAICDGIYAGWRSAAAAEPFDTDLWRCTGCGHLYSDFISQCDCMEDGATLVHFKAALREVNDGSVRS